MSDSSQNELEIFIAKFRAEAAENFGQLTLYSSGILLEIDRWIEKSRPAIKVDSIVSPTTEIAPHATLDAKDLVLVTNLLPVMNEPLKSTLLHIADMPERLNDPSLHDHLLTWIMKRSVPEARKLFFEVLHEIDNQASSVVALPVKTESRGLPLLCQIAVGDNLLAMKCCTGFCKMVINGVSVCDSHRKELCQMSESLMSMKITPTSKPLRLYAGETVSYQIQFEKDTAKYFCQATDCGASLAHYETTYGVYLCRHHAMIDNLKKLIISVDTKLVPFVEKKSADAVSNAIPVRSYTAEPGRCEMAVGDNMLRLTQCGNKGNRDIKGISDDFEICSVHVHEIRNKNKFFDGRWMISPSTPVKCFQADLKITPLRECEKDTWRCQVVVAGYPICANVATHNTIYGNLMCSVHAGYGVIVSLEDMSIPAGASKISWKAPKTQASDEELVEAVGPNLVVSKSRLYCAAIDSKTGQPCPGKLVFCSSTSGTSVGFFSVHLPANYSTSN